MSITNDNMEQLMNEVQRFIEGYRNGDDDAVIRYGQHLLRKIDLLVSNTMKRHARIISNSKLRPRPTYVGQLGGKFKAPMIQRTASLTDKKWADDQSYDGDVNSESLTPERIAEIRERYGIPDPESEAPPEIMNSDIDYREEYKQNDTRPKRFKKDE